MCLTDLTVYSLAKWPDAHSTEWITSSVGSFLCLEMACCWTFFVTGSSWMVHHQCGFFHVSSNSIILSTCNHSWQLNGDVKYFWSHWEQLNGLPPVWILSWVFIALDVVLVYNMITSLSVIYIYLVSSLFIGSLLLTMLEKIDVYFSFPWSVFCNSSKNMAEKMWMKGAYVS